MGYLTFQPIEVMRIGLKEILADTSRLVILQYLDDSSLDDTLLNVIRAGNDLDCFSILSTSFQSVLIDPFLSVF